MVAWGPRLGVFPRQAPANLRQGGGGSSAELPLQMRAPQARSAPTIPPFSVHASTRYCGSMVLFSKLQWNPRPGFRKRARSCDAAKPRVRWCARTTTMHHSRNPPPMAIDSHHMRGCRSRARWKAPWHGPARPALAGSWPVGPTQCAVNHHHANLTSRKPEHILSLV